jgi:hypothetical protein
MTGTGATVAGMDGEPLGDREQMGHELSGRDRRRALEVLALIIEFSRWTHRRVESIETLDDRTCRRRVSLDVAFGHDLRALAKERLTPLTMLRKEVLRNFDLRDEHGKPVPMLSKGENGPIAGDALTVVAEEILGNPPSRYIRGRLQRMAVGEPAESRREIEGWERLAENPTYPDRKDWRKLLASEHFRDLAQALAANFVLIAGIAPPVDSRRLFKLSYEEPFGDEADDEQVAAWKRWLSRLGWRLRQIRIEVPAVNAAKSFHIEVAAPGDLEIDSAQLRSYPRGPVTADDTDIGGTRRAHLYVSDVRSGLRARAFVYVRHQRDSYLWSAFLTALLVLFLLAVGLSQLDEILGEGGDTQTAAALLLIAPTLLAAYIARPDGHPLASKILLGVRLLVVATGLCAVVGAGVLAARFSTSTADGIWTVDLAIAGVVTLCLLASLILPRRTRAN